MLKRIRTKIILLFLLVTPLFLIPVNAFAQSNFQKGESLILGKGEVVNSNYFAAGELVNLEGTVNGDAYLAGGKVVVDGTVNGDVLAAGGTISIRGNVAGNVRVAAGQVSVAGTVGKNITAAGGQITVSEGAKISGSLTAAGGNIEVNAPLGNGVQAAAGVLSVTNSVAGDLTFAGERLSLTDDANIGGDVVYFSEKEAQISQGAVISGKVARNIPPVAMKDARKAVKGTASSVVSFWTFFSFISALIFGVILLKLAPNYFLRVSSQILTRFWANLGIGFLSVILTPIVLGVVFITIFGIPLFFILLFLYALTLYVAKLFASLFLGGLFVKKFLVKKGLFVTFLIGLVLFYLIGIIPFVGWLGQFILVLAATGALFVEKRKFYAVVRQKKLL